MPPFTPNRRRRGSSDRAFTLALMPASGGHKREWRISYATIYFLCTLCAAIGLIIAYSAYKRQAINADIHSSSELARAWIARWEILDKGKKQIVANLDELKDIGDVYFRTIFKSDADLGEIDRSNHVAELNAKLIPLQSVMRLLNAREEAYNAMPIGIAIRSNQITSLYGGRNDPFGMEESFHTGIDFAAGTGTPIHATAAGKIVGANFEDDNSLGKHVKILHRYGLITVYGHMDEVAVKKDQFVKRGDVIGFVGTTGRSTGPHLHYEVHVQNIEPENWFELTYNPMPFVREQL